MKPLPRTILNDDVILTENVILNEIVILSEAKNLEAKNLRGLPRTGQP